MVIYIYLSGKLEALQSAWKFEAEGLKQLGVPDLYERIEFYLGENWLEHGVFLRSSRLEMFYKIDAFKNFEKYTGKLQWLKIKSFIDLDWFIQTIL